MERINLLLDGLEKMNIPFSDDQLDQLQLYIDELLLWNPTHGLISAQGGTRENPEDFIPRHILDSLAAHSLFKELSPGSMADIGSGAGLPGIPLAIFLPDTEVCLVEKQKRRCNFLRNALAVTGLMKRVTVEQRAMEVLDQQFDLVTMRAFASLPDVYADIVKLIAPGGRIAAFKGTSSKIEEELVQLKRIDENLDWEIHSLTVPFLEAERNLVLIKPGF